MGVGLSISRTIVEAHGGSIVTRPNPGAGTVFSFTLLAVSKEEVGDAV
jgi:two-component system sensor kinase FixL